MEFIKLIFSNINNPVTMTLLVLNCVFMLTLSIIDVKLLSRLYEINYGELGRKNFKKLFLKIISKLTIAIIVSTIIVIFFSPICVKNKHIYITITFLGSFLIYLNVVGKNIERLFIKKSHQNKIIFNKNLENCLKNMNEFKQSFAAIIQNIGKEIEENNFAELRNSYGKMIREYKEINDKSVIVADKINESAVYNIVKNKIKLAKENNIEVKLDVNTDFSKLKIKSYELVRILGILLDNAIESASRCDGKYIEIIFLDSKNKSVIKISNTYDNREEIDLNEIFTRGYSTKEGNTGLGLWQIRRILEKYSNLDLYTHKEENIFTQELYIYNK